MSVKRVLLPGGRSSPHRGRLRSAARESPGAFLRPCPLKYGVPLWSIRSASLALRALGWVLVGIVAVSLFVVVIAAFGPLPAYVLDGSAVALPPTERVQAEASVRTAILQAVAGALLVVGAITAWRQMLIARAQHRISRRTAVTEAFAKAVELLGDEKAMALRLGGVYALDRVAEDDRAEASRVVEILASHVRGNANPNLLTKDVAAAIGVLTRRDWPIAVDLAGTDLTGHDLSNARLRAARLSNAVLRGVSLRSASLRYADLRAADLRGTDLADADLRYATLDEARLSGSTASSHTVWPDGFVPADHGVQLG